jgi:hypothetical protein
LGLRVWRIKITFSYESLCIWHNLLWRWIVMVLH